MDGGRERVEGREERREKKERETSVIAEGSESLRRVFERKIGDRERLE